MISGVVAERRNQQQHEPEPAGGDLTTGYNDPRKHAEQVHAQMLHGMCVERDYRDAGGPLVVDFVDAFVEQSVVQQAMGRVEADLVHQQAGVDVEHRRRETFQPPQVGDASSLAQAVEDIHEWAAHEYLVEQYQPQRLKCFDYQFNIDSRRHQLSISNALISSVMLGQLRVQNNPARPLTCFCGI